MAKATQTISLEHHEKLAKQNFNKTWDFLDKKDRTPEEDLEMIHTVHASRFHWGILVSEGKGTALNLQRGEWIISRVYTVLERGEPALYHAKICLDLTEKNDIGDFDLAFAYEAMARSSAVVGNKKDFEKYYQLAEEAAEKIKKKDDRDYFLDELNGGKWFGLK
ncbi:MAG: hypothetical protein ACFFD7_11420 [Candidatus Thorarchaeota archaeon]